jgi:hypothetical protein
MDQNVRDQITADKLRKLAGTYLEAADRLNAAADVLESFALNEHSAREVEAAMRRINEITSEAPA